MCTSSCIAGYLLRVLLASMCVVNLCWGSEELGDYKQTPCFYGWHLWEEAPLPSYPIMIKISASQMLVPMGKAKPSGVRELDQSQVDTTGCLPDPAPDWPGEASGFSVKHPSEGIWSWCP